MKYYLLICPVIVLMYGISCQSSDQDRISYNEHIRPIFNKKCLACHGGVKKLGGFSLLFEEEAFGPTESGAPAIVRGNHKKSELFRRITHPDHEERMPQDADPLTEAEISLIAQWIDEGAEWEVHWAYVPPVPVKVPDIDSDWVKGELDYFILEKLVEAGLQPETQADRATLLRRASLDLTGLPPAPEEVEAFINDPSPDAFEKQVEKLLASPHFGERWTTMWLDLARYADSDGYEKDPHRNIWRYRDWVIDAFNRDLPLDQFTIEQIAGDLLPDAGRDQLLATAFHRNTMTNEEGGTDDEEYRVAAVIDRLNTTFEVWQGTTMGCVQCHSHPYDPIRHEEFFESFAIFNNTLDADLSNELPVLELFQESDAKNVEEVIGFIRDLAPSLEIDESAPLSSQIRQAVYPRLLTKYCDDFHNVQFYSNVLGNWSWNTKEGLERQYFFTFEDVDLTGATHITYSYKTEGNDARMDLRIDSLNGPLINQTAFSSTSHVKGGFTSITTPLSRTETGSHDLIFEIVNTTGKAPEGIVQINGMELTVDRENLPVRELKKYQDELIALRAKADHTPVMKERSPLFRRKTQVFERGNFLMKRKEVQPGVPDVLPTMSADDAPRLAFAEWLVSKDNPLTARVIVNRFWEQLFGTGIVETVEDLGTQGMKPTHPEMLDYLSLRFMHEHKWSVKSLLREIMLSATYRQSSRVTPEKLEKDPYNQLLSRGPRYRLSAEQIRDQALAVSGLLNDSIGGESVMPYQPEGIWQQVYSAEKWVNSNDKSRHRRSLYTYWKRTTPYPSMMAFDSPSREFCVSRRIRTNTPLQALVTLNDPAYLEMAAALARRMRKAGGDDVGRAIEAGYYLALGKKAGEETLAILGALYDKASAELQNQPAVSMNINQPEYDEFTIDDPMTVVANAIMNLDGFVMKE